MQPPVLQWGSGLSLAVEAVAGQCPLRACLNLVSCCRGVQLLVGTGWSWAHNMGSSAGTGSCSRVCSRRFGMEGGYRKKYRCFLEEVGRALRCSSPLCSSSALRLGLTDSACPPLWATFSRRSQLLSSVWLPAWLWGAGAQGRMGLAAASPAR